MSSLNISSTSLASCVSSASDGASSSRAFSNLPTLRTKETFDKCPSCRVQFDFLKRGNVTKVPLILHCKHTVCEDCIRRMCLANKAVCPICNEKFTVLRSKLDSLTEVFQPHFTIIGYLVWSKNVSNKKELCWVSTGQTLREKFGGGGDAAEFAHDLNEQIDEDGDVKKAFIFEKCLEHMDQYSNIQCDECGDTYCCYCFIENHTGHKATYLYKLNEAENEELEKCKADAEVILAQLLISRKQAKQLKRFDASDVEQDVKSYFADLHAKLHLAERNIRKKLSTMQSPEIEVDAVYSTLLSATRRITNLLDGCNTPNNKQINIRALLEEARSVRDIPCRLVSNQGLLRPIEFLSDNVFDDIEENVCLKDLPSIEYSLLPIEDWSRAQEKYEMNQIRRHTEVCDKTEPQNPTPAVKTFKQVEKKSKKMVEGKTRIVVTHINDLNSFYIQKYSTLESLKEMNNMIGRRSRKKQEHEEFKLGKIYGVHYETKNSNQWRRGKVVDIFTSEDDRTQYKVFFIDYGNTQIVTRDKLRAIDIYTIERQNFAQECKLADLEGVDLEPNVHLQLPQIVGQKELYVRYLNPPGTRRTVQEVEVLVAASNGGVVSVRDLLLRTPSPPKPKLCLLSSEAKLFKNSTRFYVGQDEQVVVTHVKNPFYICVQLMRHLSIMEKMKSAMEEYYKTAAVLDSIPVIDSDVVAKYKDEDQGTYHRAKIMSVDVARKEVGVLFVDWGKDVVLPWSSLRMLTENFIKMECQGIIVKLAHLEKVDSTKPWSQQTTEFLRDQVSANKQWRMAVTKVDVLEVALFQATPSAELCLNSLLVERKLAVSTGTITENVFWPSMTDENPEEEDGDLCSQLIKKSEDIIIANDDNKSTATFKSQVKIIDFKNPDHIYIKFLKYKDTDAELHKELQIHYKSSQNKTKNSWKPGQACVVFEQNDYFRAVVRRVQKGENYVVFLYDIAKELTVHKKKIFVQEPYFDNFTCSVAKCRLSKIKPAGDGGKWSQLAIEMLQKIFTTYKNFHVAKAEMCSKQKMLGVTMWYSFTSAAKALEPAKVQFICINQSLLESGVAFTDYSTVGPPNSVEKKPSWNDLIYEAEENSVNDLLEEEEEEEEEEEKHHITFQDGWPPPFKLQNREFHAVLTCIVNEGYFLVRDENLQSLYQQVEEDLNSTFNLTSTLSITSDVVWDVNDMCTINYEGLWYRGTILEVLSPTELNVEMIDFGSEHIVLKEDVSKSIMFPDCPPLIFKIRLYDVHGEWSADDVAELLSIVSDNVKISIKGDLNLEVPFAEVYLDNGLSINDLFTRRCPHMIRTQNHIVLETVPDEDKDIDELNDSRESYTYVGFPQLGDTHRKMSVVNLLKFDSGYSVVLRSNENNSANNFTRLCDTIQRAGEKLPPLKHVQLNAPCICMHSEKKKWSRAVIYSVNSLQFGFVLVFFVDYGTVEMMSVGKLKEVRSEWLDQPVYLHIASINIKLLRNTQAEFVLMQLSSLRGSQVRINVICEEPLTVDLYGEEKLIYQEFIDAGIIKVA